LFIGYSVFHQIQLQFLADRGKKSQVKDEIIEIGIIFDISKGKA
jgi:hypothetical protein